MLLALLHSVQLIAIYSYRDFRLNRCKRCCQWVVQKYVIPWGEIPTYHGRSSILWQYPAGLLYATEVCVRLSSVFLVYCTGGEDVKQCGIDRQLFVDDTGLYGTFQPDKVTAAMTVRNLQNCCCEIQAWMFLKKLKPNDAERLRRYSVDQRQRSEVSLQSICIGESENSLSSSVRDLGRLGTGSWFRHHCTWSGPCYSRGVTLSSTLFGNYNFIWPQ